MQHDVVMRVSDLMTRDVASVQPRTSLHEAAELMRSRDCGAVPVLDDGGRAIGILTDRDIMIAALETNRPLADMRASDAMTRPAITVHEDERLSHAESLMCRYQIRRLPVVNNEGRVLGILALGDLARVAGRDPERTEAGREAVAATLAAISSPPPGPSHPPPDSEPRSSPL